MALIQGVGSLFLCPRCLIPEDKQGDLSVRAPLQTMADARAKLQEAQGEWLATERKNKLKAVGLQDVDVCLCFYYPHFVPPLTTPERMYFGE